MKVSNPTPTHDGFDPVDRAAKALLRNSYVALGDREYVFEAEYLQDLHTADVAYILDSECTCTMDYIGGDVVERTCEYCLIKEKYQNDDSIPY